MAIMMTEAHFHLLLRTVAAQTRSAGEERGGGGLRKVSANAFSRLTKFAKGEEDGKDWNFDIADIMGMECPELLQNLKVIEPMSEEMTAKVRELDVDKADNIGRTLVGNPRSCLLFQPLLILVGIINSLVRHVPFRWTLAGWIGATPRSSWGWMR